MAKRSNKNEYVNTIYGIHYETFEVVAIFVTRGGAMHRMHPNGHLFEHLIVGDRRPESEAIIVFKLTDIFSTPTAFGDSDSTKRKLAELEKKASDMKATHEAKKRSMN